MLQKVGGTDLHTPCSTSNSVAFMATQICSSVYSSPPLLISVQVFSEIHFGGTLQRNAEVEASKMHRR